MADRDYVPDRPGEWGIHADILEERAYGTCTWLLETPEFRRWFGDPTARLLYLRGGAQSGKTHLAATVIDFLLRRPNMPVQPFVFPFYFEDEVEKISGGGESGTMPWSWPHFVKKLRDHVEYTCRKLFSDQEWDALEEEINMQTVAAQLMTGLVRGRRPVYIIFDGLENYTRLPDEVNILLDSVLSQSFIKVLVTSRKVNGFTSAMESRQAIIRDVVAPPRDIELYIQFRVRKEMSEYLQYAEDIGIRLMQHMGRQASFLFAGSLLDILAVSKDQNQLRTLLGRLMANKRANYAAALHAIGLQNEHDAATAMDALAWIFIADNDITADVLQFGLAIAPGRLNPREHFAPGNFEEYIVRITQGLVEFFQDDGRPLPGYEMEDGETPVESYRRARFIEKDAEDIRDIVGDALLHPYAFVARQMLTYLNQKRYTTEYMDDHDIGIFDYKTQEPFINWASVAWLEVAPIEERLILHDFVDYLEHVGQAQFLCLLLTDYQPEDNLAMDCLYAAAHSGMKRTFLELLRCEYAWAPDPELLEAMHGMGPLHLVAKYGEPSDLNAPVIFEGELDRWNLNEQDHNGQTAFSHAAQGGAFEIVQRLLATGRVDVNIADNTGKSPLRRAIKIRKDELPEIVQGQLNVVDLLINQPNINVNAQDNKGRSALIRVATLDIDESIQMKLAGSLLKHPQINRNLRDNQGRSALDYARNNGKMQLAELIEVGIQRGPPTSWLASNWN